MVKSLFIPRWNEVLVAILNNNGRISYCERINRKVRGSMTHLRNIVKLLENKNLIEIKPKKNVKRIILTDKGRKISIALQQIKEELKQTNQ